MDNIDKAIIDALPSRRLDADDAGAIRTSLAANGFQVKEERDEPRPVRGATVKDDAATFLEFWIEAEEAASRQAGEIEQLTRERDEARAGHERWKGLQGGTAAVVNQLEGDIARLNAELDVARAQIEKLQRQKDSLLTSRRRNELVKKNAELLAELSKARGEAVYYRMRANREIGDDRPRQFCRAGLTCRACRSAVADRDQ